MSVHQTEDGRWFCKWYEKGKIKKPYFGHGDLAKVQAERKDEEVKRDRGKLQVHSISIEQLCHMYHNQHAVEKSTVDSDFYRLTAVIIPALGSIPAEALSTQQLNQYIQDRLKAGKKRGTVAREISILKAAFGWAERQDPPLIVRNPVAKFRLPRSSDKDVPSPPSQDKVRRILECAEPHLMRGLYIEWYAGVRPGGEVSRIKWSDVDLENNTIRVISARKGGPVMRYVPIGAALRELMLQWQTEDRALVEDVSSLPVVHYNLKPVMSLKRSWKTAKRKAGITRRLRLHDLRHAMISKALRSGADLKSVSEVAGHSRPDTTLREYTHVTQEQHRRVVETIPDLGTILGTKKDGTQSQDGSVK